MNEATELSTSTETLEFDADAGEQYTGTRPWLFRPPFIDHNKSMHEALDHTFINGIGCSDWMAERSTQQRFEELIPKVQDGDIILLHDFTGNDNTVEALRMIIPKLKEMVLEILRTPVCHFACRRIRVDVS